MLLFMGIRGAWWLVSFHAGARRLPSSGSARWFGMENGVWYADDGDSLININAENEF